MTVSTTSLGIGAASAGAMSAAAAQAAQSGDNLMAWVLGAVVALAGFIGLVFRWMMVRNDKMHDANVIAAAEREKRMQDRADAQLALNETHITTMQGIADSLTVIHGKLDAVPRMTADEIDHRKRA